MDMPKVSSWSILPFSSFWIQKISALLADQSSSSILYSLYFVDTVVGKSIQKFVAIINPSSNKHMHKSLSTPP